MKICVLGGGIIGLSTALNLKLERPDFEVVIITDKTTPFTTGDGAAGIWQPYLLEGCEPNSLSRWLRGTWDFMEKSWKTPEAGDMGIFPLHLYLLNRSPTPESNEILHGLRKLSLEEISKLNLEGDIREAYDCVTYIMETRKLLPWMVKRFEDLGGVMIAGKRIENLKDFSLTEGLSFDAIVNCLGISNYTVSNDNAICPIKGQVKRVKMPWITFSYLADDAYAIPK